jgi:CO/xanthine dehydrogenase Mo-binding subunit
MTSVSDRTDSPEAPGVAPDPFGFRVVHHSVPRTDGPGKVTGSAIFTADIPITNLTYAKVLRSPIGHGRIVSIDASAALQRAGVICVVTGDDLASLHNARFGHAIKDHPVLALDKVRFIGEPVAAVVAETEIAAQLALDDIVVEYDDLPSVITAEDALADGAPLVHETRYGQGVSPGHVELTAGETVTNVCQENHVQWGDVDAAFA